MPCLAYGHRGALALAPENTMAGFRKALELGADGIELDVHVTADGQVVVMHDCQVDRTTNGTGLIRKLKLEELRRLDAACRFAGRAPSECVPTLEEALALARGKLRVQIEIKREAPEALGPAIEVIRRMKMEAQCSLLSFSDALMAKAKRLAPEIPAELIAVFPLLQISRALRAGVDVLDLPDVLVTRRIVARAHQAGLRVGTGITNDEAKMRRLIAAGVDAIYSDRPDVLVRVVKREARS